MKRAVLVSGAAVALGAAGCGWYTNVPAMIHVKSVEPATVTVEFSTNVADKTIKATFTQPTITLEGQPGSIGATFKDMRIAYYDPEFGKKADVASPSLAIFSGKELNLKAYVRVDTSALHEDPSKEYVEMKDIPDKRLIIGSTKFVAPVINNDVVALGSPNAGAQRKSIIFARVVLDGEDDAKFAYSKEIFIPISFVDGVK